MNSDHNTITTTMRVRECVSAYAIESYMCHVIIMRRTQRPKHSHTHAHTLSHTHAQGSWKEREKFRQFSLMGKYCRLQPRKLYVRYIHILVVHGRLFAVSPALDRHNFYSVCRAKYAFMHETLKSMKSDSKYKIPCRHIGQALCTD